MADVQAGSLVTFLVVGDNVVVPAPPVGKLRVVSLNLNFNSSFLANDDDTFHVMVFKIGSTQCSRSQGLPNGFHFGPDGGWFDFSSLVLAAGETLVVNVSLAIDIPNSVWAFFSWFDVDTGGQYGVSRVSVPSTTPVTIVPAPPSGKTRRLLISLGVGGFSADQVAGYFFNGDVGPVDLTVRLTDGIVTTGNIGQTLPTSISDESTMFGLSLSGNQSVQAFLGSTPVVPLQFYGVYEDFPATS